MAKKRKNPFEDPFMGEGAPSSEFNPTAGGSPSYNYDDLAGLFVGLDVEDGAELFSMLRDVAEVGITPEEYTIFYSVYNNIMRPLMLKEEAQARKTSKKASKTTQKKKEGNKKSSDFSEKTLVLKIEMSGIKNPPMWREVEVPADMTFSALHDVIQCVTGLEHGHLWEFRKGKRDGITIGMLSNGPFEPGLDDVTYEADRTPLYAILNRTRNSIDYIYDFGDNWEFKVTVQKVLPKKTEHPVCTAFESELNAIEDTGGPWNYFDMRAALRDWDKLSEDKKDEAVRPWEMDNDEYHDFLMDNCFNMAGTNERLKKI